MAGIVQTARDEGIQQGRVEGVRQGRVEGIQQGRVEGIQQGRVEGIQQGRVEGERAVLQRLLHRRFGNLSPRIAERLRQASAAELESWADNVLDARSLEEVFDPGA